MMDNDFFNNLPINDDPINDTITTIQRKSGSYKGSRIKGNDRKDLINEIKFRKKIKKLKGNGFTNSMAIYILALLTIGLLLGFVLAWKSINTQYMGALACFTVCFTPIGTACSIVLGKVVDKNKEENTGADGTGITFAAAQANNFKSDVDELFDNSPAI